MIGWSAGFPREVRADGSGNQLRTWPLPMPIHL